MSEPSNTPEPSDGGSDQRLVRLRDVTAFHISHNMLAGRKGHGGGPCTRRVLYKEDIAQIAKCAFEAGWHAANSQPNEQGLATAPPMPIAE